VPKFLYLKLLLLLELNLYNSTDLYEFHHT